VLRLAALACDEATQDPIDLAILQAARSRGLRLDLARRRRFVPFDPATKRSEAIVQQDGMPLHVVKGAPAVVAGLCEPSAQPGAEVDSMAAEGLRVLADAVGADDRLRCAGLDGLYDPPRDDSAAVVARLRALGVRVVMVTGDGIGTARAVGARVGLGDRVCPVEVLRQEAHWRAARL
jgi:H+-transporting ATPase